MKRLYVCLLVAWTLISSSFPSHAQGFIWPGGRSMAVSLSYDDALSSQLDNAIPALDAHNIKASFYILPSSSVMNERMAEWRAAAATGHELGNHSVNHPCSASLPNRDWVAEHHDLDRYSIEEIVEEVATANTFLKAIDGGLDRTFTAPCGDVVVAGESYLNKIKDNFIAIKGQGVESGFSIVWSPEGATGDQLIDYIERVPAGASLVNIIFHGVGGDYLSVSSAAHSELLGFLVSNAEIYYVDSFINIMEYKNKLEHEAD